jgi:hypothetical protein
MLHFLFQSTSIPFKMASFLGRRLLEECGFQSHSQGATRDLCNAISNTTIVWCCLSYGTLSSYQPPGEQHWSRNRVAHSLHTALDGPSYVGITSSLASVWWAGSETREETTRSHPNIDRFSLATCTMHDSYCQGNSYKIPICYKLTGCPRHSAPLLPRE